MGCNCGDCSSSYCSCCRYCCYDEESTTSMPFLRYIISASPGPPLNATRVLPMFISFLIAKHGLSSNTHIFFSLSLPSLSSPWVWLSPFTASFFPSLSLALQHVSLISVSFLASLYPSVFITHIYSVSLHRPAPPPVCTCFRVCVDQLGFRSCSSPYLYLCFSQSLLLISCFLYSFIIPAFLSLALNTVKHRFTCQDSRILRSLIFGGTSEISATLPAHYRPQVTLRWSADAHVRPSMQWGSGGQVHRWISFVR